MSGGVPSSRKRSSAWRNASVAPACSSPSRSTAASGVSIVSVGLSSSVSKRVSSGPLGGAVDLGISSGQTSVDRVDAPFPPFVASTREASDEAFSLAGGRGGQTSTTSLRLTPITAASAASRSATTSLSGTRAARPTSSRTASDAMRRRELASTSGTPADRR